MPIVPAAIPPPTINVKPPLYILQTASDHQSSPLGGPTPQHGSRADKTIIAHQAAFDAFETEEVKNALQMDIADFSKRIKRITHLFEDVQRVITTSTTKSPRLGPTGDLSQQWGGHFGTFRKLMWESRDLATYIATSCDQFQLGVLDLAKDAKTEEEINTVIEFVNDQIKTVSENKRRAVEQADSFADLRLDITAFKAELNDTLGVQNDSGFIEANYRQIQLDDQIDSISHELRSLQDEVRLSESASKMRLPIFGSTGILALFPRASLRLIGAGVLAFSGDVISKSSKYAEAKSVIRRKKWEIMELENKKQALGEQFPDCVQVCYRLEVLARANSDISEVMTGLSSFEEIWAAVNCDCQAINTYFTSMKGSGSRSPIPLVMETWMKTGKTYYGLLASSLRIYASGMDTSGLAG